VWLESCNRTLAERFMYDRVSQEIYNPNSSSCFDMQDGGSIPGTPVWIFVCLGGAGQRWTYDNENQIFRNMLGNTLDVSGETIQPGQSVVTQVEDGSAAELWQ
jgi:hypothetical protein